MDKDTTKLALYGELFAQMMQLPWFKDMIECRFDIQQVIDDDTKTIVLQAIEVPPQEVMKRMKKKADNSSEKIVVPEPKLYV